MSNELSSRRDIAEQYFLSGYNCTQAVVLAFSDILPIPKDALLKVACSFGGGMGRLREVCGTVSAMLIVAGLLYGYDIPDDPALKSEHYRRIQQLAKEFERQNGSIVCRDLLGLDIKHDDPSPEPRTPEYYKKRPCKSLVGDAAEILEKYISDNPPSN